ncbi:MAG: hypothetical protein ABIA37_02335 [Candidatus Woesearchaeota archaeon]
MGVLKKGLVDAVKGIKKHRSLFLILILLQLVFIVSVSAISINYQIKIYDNVQNILSPLDEANYNATAIEEGQPFMNEMMKEVVTITKSYQEMISNIFQMLSWILACFLLLEGWSWCFSHYIYSKGEVFKYWSRFMIISLTFLIPLAVVGYFVLKSMIGLDLAVFSWGIRIVDILLLVTGYFMTISFSLLTLKIKPLFRKIYLVGISKAPWFLLGLALTLLAVLISLVLVYLSMESLFLMILSVLILVVVMVFSKLYLIGIVRELIREDEGSA